MRKRDNQVIFRLNDSENDIFIARTQKSGLSQQEFLRRAALDVPIKEQPPADYPKLIREISAIGNNVNQIAFQANATGHVPHNSIETVKAYLFDIWQMVKGIGG